MFSVDGLKRFMVSMHFHVPSIDVLVESLKSKHDAQHVAFNVGVTTFCFSQRLTSKCHGAIGLQQCSPDSSPRSINLNDEWLCTVIVSKHLIGGDGLLQV